MEGACIIRFVWTEGGDAPFIFHLRDLTIDSVAYNGTIVAPETIGVPTDATYHHEVTPTATPAAGDTATVTVFYHGTMTDELGPQRWGGVSSGAGILYAMGVGFANNYVSATQHWMPCYDHPDDKALFTGRFTVIDTMTVASNGLLTDLVDEGGNEETYVWHHEHPASTYLLTFAVGPYAELNVGDAELPMLLYALPADTAMTRRSFAKLPQMVAGFGEYYGDYPFEKVGYVNTPQGAMEHQTMVSYPTSLARSGDSLNLVGAHELAHQWFGDLVSPVDFRHAWLNESFATFSEALWMEVAEGYEGYLARQQGALTSYLGQVAPFEGLLPLYDFPRASPSSNYPATIYEKGAVVVGMLRYQLAESRFFLAMRTYLQRHAYGTASTDDMIAVCEEIYGADLDWFFDQWVRQPGWPIFRITAVPGGAPSRVSVTIEQIQPESHGRYTHVPLELSLVTAGGTIDRIVTVDSMVQTFDMSISGGPLLDLLANQGPSIRTLAQFESINVSSVEDDDDAERTLFRVQPDPVTDRTDVTIVRTGGDDDDVTLRLYDSAGRKISEQEIERFPHSLSVKDLPPGLYMIILEHEDGRHTLTVTVQR
jgi:aminopeptidase N